MKVAWDLLGDRFCTVLVPSLQLFGLRALLHSLGLKCLISTPNTHFHFAKYLFYIFIFIFKHQMSHQDVKYSFSFAGDGILFVIGVQLCRDLLPKPHFKHFSWAELSIMLVLQPKILKYSIIMKKS